MKITEINVSSLNGINSICIEVCFVPIIILGALAILIHSVNHESLCKFLHSNFSKITWLMNGRRLTETCLGKCSVMLVLREESGPGRVKFFVYAGDDDEALEYPVTT